MSDYSIELAAEQIIDPRTREYFREVYSSYVAGNYRSAVVMLWSVIVCDLLFKLEDLKARNDPAAAAIMKEVEKKQQENQKSPAWEQILVELVEAKTHLFDVGQAQNIEGIRQHRHLSAHPVLTASTYELFRPTRENVRSHMRNALEAILTKPALMSGKIFETFVTDLTRAAVTWPYVGDEADVELGRYLDAVYFSRLSKPVLEVFFRKLWRFTFKLEDADAEANRAINYRALRLLYRKHHAAFTTLIATDTNYYSDVALGGKAIKELVRFVSLNPGLYPLLTDAARGPLKACTDSDDDMLAIAWFLSPDLSTHISQLQVRSTGLGDRFALSPVSFARLYLQAKAAGLQRAVIDLGSSLYCNSDRYDTANERFVHMVLPYADQMDKDQMKTLLTGINANQETWGRARAEQEHGVLKEVCDTELGPDFDYSPFPNFIRGLPKPKSV